MRTKRQAPPTCSPQLGTKILITVVININRIISLFEIIVVSPNSQKYASINLIIGL
jgi:hypothetical protein